MKVAEINRELDIARAAGPLRDIIIPPCPELLAELQLEVSQGDRVGTDRFFGAQCNSHQLALAGAFLGIVHPPFSRHGLHCAPVV